MSSKRLPWLLLGACWLLPLAASLPTARAASDDAGSGGKIDVNFFYDTLKDEGSWFNTTEYGDVWQPYIAYKSDSWRPYTDGYWSYTDGGWMFVSNESFGWAVYHYGRWTKLQDIGWAWVPGTEWAPAWVTWRESKPDGAATGAPAANAPVSATTTDAPAADDKNPATSAPSAPPADNPPPPGGAPDGNYIGWAPLPPTPVGYDPNVPYGPGVDAEFGVDPYDYCFTSYAAFGSPWLAGVIFAPDLGYYCCGRSINITNGYYDNGRGGYRGFYNGGPDFNRFRGVTQRPIPQLTLRQTTRSSLAREQIRNGQFNRINGNHIDVAAPRFSQANVRNGRVNFTHQGTLPVTAVGKQAPAAAANNPAYKRAQESFARQGEAYRAQNPRGASPTAAANGAAGLATTPRAQQEERQARQEAERQGGPAGGNHNPREARNQAAGPNGAPAAAPRTSSRQSRGEARQSTRQSRGQRNEERAVRQPRQSAAPRVERPAPRVERGGGGGGERRGGGGGGGGGGDKKKK